MDSMASVIAGMDGVSVTSSTYTADATVHMTMTMPYTGAISALEQEKLFGKGRQTLNGGCNTQPMGLHLLSDDSVTL